MVEISCAFVIAGIIYSREGGETLMDYWRSVSITLRRPSPASTSNGRPILAGPHDEHYLYYDYLNFFVFLVKHCGARSHSQSAREAFESVFLLFRFFFHILNHVAIPIVRLFEYRERGISTIHIDTHVFVYQDFFRFFLCAAILVPIGFRWSRVGEREIDSLAGPNGDYTANQPFVSPIVYPSIPHTFMHMERLCLLLPFISFSSIFGPITSFCFP